MTLDPKYLKKRLEAKEHKILSPSAAFSNKARRYRPDPAEKKGYRLSFSVDTDRILNSHSYTRYIDKTQVFSLIKNDHITHRVLHVQLVSRIARTIGRALALNEDLIEAISLGHDIGHTPFGHDGEVYLSELCEEHGIGQFHHNIQSVHFLNHVEKNGNGWNLTLETLDGIFCHNGEVHDTQLGPRRGKGFDDLEREIEQAMAGLNPRPVPTTLEGCLVRMADTVSYLGRDIDDAIRLGLLTRSDLPESSTRILGQSNGTMVYTMVTDIIENSLDKDVISYSPELSVAIRALKEFNLEKIYKNQTAKQHLTGIRDLFKRLFDRYMDDLLKGREDSAIITQFLSHMNEKYSSRMPHAAVVRDFMAGMTDRFFLDQCPDHLRPSILYLNHV